MIFLPPNSFQRLAIRLLLSCCLNVKEQILQIVNSVYCIGNSMIINNVARFLFFTFPNLQELEEQVDPVASKKL